MRNKIMESLVVVHRVRLSKMIKTPVEEQHHSPQPPDLRRYYRYNTR